MPQTTPAGFRLEHDDTKLTAWGPDLASAFEAAFSAMLQVAGAPDGIEPGDKSVTIQASGATPSELFDALALAIQDEGAAQQPLDGSISMGGVVKSDTGWNGWAALGIDPSRKSPINPFELPVPPRVERKPGRVVVKVDVMVWDDKMREAMNQLRAIMPPEFHPGGVFGPDPFAPDNE